MFLYSCSPRTKSGSPAGAELDDAALDTTLEELATTELEETGAIELDELGTADETTEETVLLELTGAIDELELVTATLDTATLELELGAGSLTHAVITAAANVRLKGLIKFIAFII